MYNPFCNIPFWIESLDEFPFVMKTLCMRDIVLPDKPDEIRYFSETGRSVAIAVIRINKYTTITLGIVAKSGEQAEHGYLEFVSSYQSREHQNN